MFVVTVFTISWQNLPNSQSNNILLCLCSHTTHLHRCEAVVPTYNNSSFIIMLSMSATEV